MYLSIIVPAFNEEDYIMECLESLRAQTITRFELIVVDNNSTDKTSEIAVNYTDNLLFESKQGYHNAVKCGIENATGDLVTVCDADSLYESDWVETIYRVFGANTIGIYGSVNFHDGHLIYRTLIRFFCFTIFMRLMRIIGIDVCNGFNFVFRKDAYLKVGGYDPQIFDNVGLDIHLGRRLKQLGRLRFVPALKVRTSMRRISERGLWHFISVNLAMYWAFIRGKEGSTSYDEYNVR